MSEQRRLAAIVSADVAGYSRLMGRNESGTLAALKSLRQEVVHPAIAATSAPGGLQGAVSENGRLRHGAAGHLGECCRRALMLAILSFCDRSLMCDTKA